MHRLTWLQWVVEVFCGASMLTCHRCTRLLDHAAPFSIRKPWSWTNDAPGRCSKCGRRGVLLLPVHHCAPEPSSVPFPMMVTLVVPTAAVRNVSASVALALGQRVDLPASSTAPFASWSVACDGSVSGHDTHARTRAGRCAQTFVAELHCVSAAVAPASAARADLALLTSHAHARRRFRALGAHPVC